MATAGHVDSADVWALNTMRCRGREPSLMNNTCNAAGYDAIHQCSRTHRGKSYPTRLASRLASLLLPTLTARMQRTCYDLGMRRDR